MHLLSIMITPFNSYNNVFSIPSDYRCDKDKREGKQNECTIYTEIQ